MNKILLADDDGDMLKLTARWMERAGHTVITAESGEEALVLLKSEKPNLVILDYAMPGMDGPAVFERIKGDPEYKDTPVLFRTGADDEGATDVMEKLHPEGVVMKSEGKAALMAAVEAALQ